MVRLGCNLQCYILWQTENPKNQQHAQVSDMAAAVLQKQTSFKKPRSPNTRVCWSFEQL